LITAAEIAHGLAGAVRVVRLDAQVRDWFDDSLVAARRSFWGVALIFPLFVLVELMPLPAGSPPAREFDFGLTLATYVIAATAYPVAAWHMTRAFGLAASYARYLTAYNWFGVLQSLVFAPLYMLVSLGGGDVSTFLLVYLADRVCFVIYAVFIARTMLRAEFGQAIILMAIDLMISQSLGQMIAALRAVPQP
jgi:hypothetical protein